MTTLRSVGTTFRWLGPVLLVSSGIGSLFVLRYLGLWSENDTAVFVNVGRLLTESGRLDHPGSYPHGYGYPVWLSQTASMLGVSVDVVTQQLLPILGNLFLGLFGFVAFRGLLGSAPLGALAALTLFLVPELVFTVSRGNHEKLTVSLTLLALVILLRSFVELGGRRRWSAFAAWAVLYYVVAFVLASMNVFFGSSFIIASTAALVFALVANHALPSLAARLNPITRRLVLISATSWVVVVLVMFFVYPPAGEAIRVMSSAAERVSALALSRTPEADPYAVTRSDWASATAYRVVSSFRWVLLFGSLVTWLSLVRTIFGRGSRVPLHLLYLTALYAAFALQVGAAMVVDLVGLAAGTNLQVRAYAYFALLAAPMFAYGLSASVNKLTSVRPSRKGTAMGALGAILTLFLVASLLKATLDPSMSNRWLFYRQSEVAAMRFWDRHVTLQELWVGSDGRLRHAFETRISNGTQNENGFSIQSRSPSVSHALDSRLVRASSLAWRQPQPPVLAEDRTYDNGDVRLHHRTSTTPFQR